MHSNHTGRYYPLLANTVEILKKSEYLPRKLEFVLTSPNTDNSRISDQRRKAQVEGGRVGEW